MVTSLESISSSLREVHSAMSVGFSSSFYMSNTKTHAERAKMAEVHECLKVLHNLKYDSREELEVTIQNISVNILQNQRVSASTKEAFENLSDQLKLRLELL